MANKTTRRTRVSTPTSRAKAEAEDRVRALLSDVLRARQSDPLLFPGGITRLRVSGRDFEFEAEGPATYPAEPRGAGEAERISDAAHTVPLDAIEEAGLVPGVLNLGASAAAAAKALLDKFPDDVVFTSGRRTVTQQAAAMAANVVSNRKYIEGTYKASPQRDALQKWVDTNSSVSKTPELAKGLESVMNTWTEVQQRNFSRHLTGDAFDVKPVAGEIGKKIQDAMRNLPKLNWITFNEAGLEIWHVQFDA